MITANNITIYELLHTPDCCSFNKTTQIIQSHHSESKAPANNTEEMKNSRSSSGFFFFCITLLCSFAITSTESFTLAHFPFQFCVFACINNEWQHLYVLYCCYVVCPYCVCVYLLQHINNCCLLLISYISCTFSKV